MSAAAPVAAPARAGVLPAPAADPAPAGAADRRRARLSWLPAAGVGAAVGLWLWSVLSVGAVQHGTVGDYGLVAIMPWSYFAALAVLSVSFVTTLYRGAARTWLVLHVVALVVLLHATVPLLYDAPRYAWVYKHIGVTDALLTHGRVDPTVDVYHSWPAFFALTALLASAAGLDSAFALAPWTQVAVNLVTVAVLAAAYGGMTGDRRVRWLALWLFVAANWTGQDYFAPQAFAFVLYLAAVAVVVRHLRRGDAGDRDGRPALVPGWLARRLPRAPAAPGSGRPPPARAERTWLALAALLACAVIAVSHPLTPVVLVGATVALALTGHCRPWVLVAAGTLVLGWNLTMASHFLAETPAWYDSFGQLFGNVEHNLVDLTFVSTGRRTVAWTARLLAAFVWLGALIGAWRSYRAGTLALPGLALFCVPFPLLVAQSYGGEMLFRIYLFTLPWAALLIAGGLVRAGGARARQALLVSAVAGAILAAGTVAYFGQERMNQVPAAEVHAARWLYANTPVDSLHLLVSPNFPTNISPDYADYRSFALTWEPDFRHRMPGVGAADWVAELADRLDDGAVTATYVVATPAMAAESELLGELPTGGVAALADQLRSSARFAAVYDRGGVTVFRYDQEGSGARRR